MLVTIGVNSEGIRLSRITIHGEEIVLADLEDRVLAAKLWQKIARAELTGHVSVFKDLEDSVKRADALQRRLEALLVRVEKATNALQIAATTLQPVAVAAARRSPPAQAQ